MRFYEFGEKNKRTLMLLPGTKCHWKNNFIQVLPLLEKDFHVICVSYDGFDENENTTYPDMLAETEKIEAYVLENSGGKLDIIYGSSLGGSFVALLAARERIHMRHGILGSSDMDQSGRLAAKINQAISNPAAYRILHTGAVPGWITFFMTKAWGKDYTEAALRMMGIGGVDMSFVSKESCYRQDYYDAITPLPEKISVSGTQIHIFYALKMGKKYRKRYLKYFRNPDIICHDYEHEELLMCFPEEWVREIKRCTGFLE